MLFKLGKKIPYAAVLMTAALLFAGSPTAVASPQSDYEEADELARQAAAAYDAAFENRELAVREAMRFESKVAAGQLAVDKARKEASDAAVAMYKDSDRHILWEMLLTSDDLADVINSLDAYARIAQWQSNSFATLRNSKEKLERSLASAQQAKTEAEKALVEAEQAKIEANEKRDAAREAYEQAQREQEEAAAAAARRAASTYSAPSSSSGAYAQTSSSWNDEQSAKEYIIYRESRGNYSATNGRYYGAYQLDSSYLGGDYSPQHQDEVAESYVQGRYGSWTAAAEFWDSHSWY